jgi:multiple sugar transport system ATP-binding protein
VPTAGRVALEGSSVIPVPGLRRAPGQAVTFGMRPEHLSLGGQGIPARWWWSSPPGADTQIYAKSAAGA